MTSVTRDWKNLVGRLMKYKTYLQYALLVLGITISAILVIAFPNFYSHYDIGVFVKWAKYWNKGWQDIYLSCSECNYPILGMFSSAGLLSLLGGNNPQNAVWTYRIILAIIDGINVLLIFFLLREFSIKNAALWAGITGLLVSSWAGAAVWGQIDDISQFFLLLTLLWIVICNLSMRMNFILYLGISSLLLGLLLLTKQLIVFSFIPIELLLMVSIFSSRKRVSAVGYMALHFIFLAFFVLLWDHFLHLEEPYISHLQLIWGVRSTQGDFISANGFNIWLFIRRGMYSSSHVPFIIFSQSVFSGIFNPFNIGILLFLALVAILSISILLNFRRRKKNGDTFLNKEVLLNFILYLAIVNLIFNLVLAGTHERYLYHFYPFVLLACLGLREYSKLFTKTLLVVILIGSSLYGLFVLGIIPGILSDFTNAHGYLINRIMGFYHVGLLCVLVVIILKYQGFVVNLKSILEKVKIR